MKRCYGRFEKQGQWLGRRIAAERGKRRVLQQRKRTGEVEAGMG